MINVRSGKPFPPPRWMPRRVPGCGASPNNCPAPDIAEETRLRTVSTSTERVSAESSHVDVGRRRVSAMLLLSALAAPLSSGVAQPLASPYRVRDFEVVRSISLARGAGAAVLARRVRCRHVGAPRGVLARHWRIKAGLQLPGQALVGPWRGQSSRSARR